MAQRRRSNKAATILERSTLTGLGRLVVPDYEARLHWYQRLISEALEGLLRFTRYRGTRGGYARVAVSMPARHGKSLHGVELLPALALGLYPDMKIMIGTNTAKLAKKSIRNTRAWMKSERYRARYATRVGKELEIIGRKESGKVEAENTAHMFRTLKRSGGGDRYVEGEGYVMAQGIGGSLIGEGFEIGIMDDLIKNAEQALSDKHRAKLWDFYLSTFDTRGDHPWASQLYIGHRWTKPDFIDEIIDHWRSESTEGHALPVKVIKLPALAFEPIADYDPREVGEGLDIETFRPRAFYEGKRNALLSRRPWIWHGMWQQDPSFTGSKFFQPEDWQWYGKTFELAQRLVLVDFSIDAALSETGQSFFVINVYGYLHAGTQTGADAGEHFFYLDERRGHWNTSTLYEQFEYLWRKWSRALPAQFDEATIMQRCHDIYENTWVEGDPSAHHARARVWVENKALGPEFISHYKNTQLIPNVTTTLSITEVATVSDAIYAVPKMASKVYCCRTASQVTGMGRVWLPQESFGEDPLDPSQPLVDATPLGIVWEQDADGKWHKSKGPDYDGSWVHEQGNFPSTPDDRRDVLAQQIMCRTPWIGPDRLGTR